jgi:hypothetical protein
VNKVVIDTNVLLVANGQHQDISLDCEDQCIHLLTRLQKHGVTVIDDDFRILGEYQHKTSLNPPKGVGDVFLKFLLREQGNPKHVEQVTITEVSYDVFGEFPDDDLQPQFDAPDRKFAAVANAHHDKPPILQAADCKWLDWWPTLNQYGVQVQFVCPEDACKFYINKFPNKSLPALPEKA